MLNRLVLRARVPYALMLCACVPCALLLRALVPYALLLCALMPCAAPARAAEADTRGWLGFYSEPRGTLPEILSAAGGPAALRGATVGLAVTVVFPDSPAELGGLRAGDIIIAVDGRPFTCPAESVQTLFRRDLDSRRAHTPCPLRVIRDAADPEITRGDRPVSPREGARFWRDPAGFVDTLALGSTLSARVTKRQVVLDLPIVLGLRPEARWPAPRGNDQIYPPALFAPSAFAPLVEHLADTRGIRADLDDLRARLARCHLGCDPFRLECMIYAHRDPLRLESVARHVGDIFARSVGARDLLVRAAHLWVPAHPPSASVGRWPAPPSLPAASARTAEPNGTNSEEPPAVTLLLQQVTAHFAAASTHQARAFAELSAEDRAFLAAERWNLSDAFAGEVYIHLDEDRERFTKNQRLIDIAARVDYPALLEAALALAPLSDPRWARAAGELLREAYADSLDREILLARETPYGRMLIGGTRAHWYRDGDAALIFDLGGDDFYSGNNGGSAGWETPLALCIDLAGNDAYESTLRSAQGSGCLGAGGLLDLAGDDQYIGLQWCQGTGYFGVGWLHDCAGDDTYRGRTFCQGVGLFGVGLLIDERGRDRYEGDCHVQGAGLARGIGALVDRAGDDEYYAKGLYPTGYGDAGIFDAWSQGCGMGFRTLASGGLGLVSDGGGCDRMEAGNFSQGGGYYYGFGIVDARGGEDDVYIGSRYNQGFSAHQAVGVFLEEGGDDDYSTRQGVAQGLAWDECVTLFVDRAGDDHYSGGAFFSQGAAAHNSFCFFLDRAGGDRYRYVPGQARAGGNDYHGGTSFALFIDEGGAADAYDAAGATNGASLYEPEHGFFLDLEGDLLLERSSPRSRTP